MFEPVDREWRFYIDDMIGFAEKVIACNGGRRALALRAAPGQGRAQRCLWRRAAQPRGRRAQRASSL